MIENLYAILDSKSQAFQPPFATSNDETAKRMFASFTHQVPTMANHPEDFILYKVGTFDDSTGAVAAASPIELVVDGYNCILAFTRKTEVDTDE